MQPSQSCRGFQGGHFPAILTQKIVRNNIFYEWSRRMLDNRFLFISHIMTLILYTTWYIWWSFDEWYQGTRVMVMLCALVRCIVISAHCHSNRGIMVNHLIHELRTGIALQYGITQWFTLIIIETDNIMLLKSFIGYTKLLINRLLFNT